MNLRPASENSSMKKASSWLMSVVRIASPTLRRASQVNRIDYEG